MSGRVIFAILSALLIICGTPPLALMSGIVFALIWGVPFPSHGPRVAKWLLQICVVLLGFGMNLPEMLRLGLHGSLFAAVTIVATLLLGWWLGRRLQLGGKTSVLISAGTAICGGSAIAAVSSVIAASEAEIAVSIGTVFLLNAVALYVFPLAGHLLHLSQAQFGLWAGVAVHDISSVVGAAISYGSGALETATAVKLSRTLWIAPLTLGLAFAFGRVKNPADGKASQRKEGRGKMTIPWFIGLFLLASLLRSYLPPVAAWSPMISEVATRGMIVVLFLVGTALSPASLRTVGWRTVTAGLALWLFVSASSLLAICLLKLTA